MSEQEAYDYGELLVVQHADHTGPSDLVPMLDGRANKRPWRTLRPDRGDGFPAAADGIAGVLLLGGPMGVDDTDEHPWITEELAFVRRAVEGEVPVLGICLGHQLLATALGGQVRTRETPEIGLLPLTRSEAAQDDELFAGYPDGSLQIVIHDDEVTSLPDGAEVMLHGSDGTTAFRAANGLAYGVQFHPETSADLFETWATRPESAPRFEAAGVDAAQMVADVHARARFLRSVGVALVGRWVDGVVGAHDPMPRRPRKAS
ncbi:MAG TPA: type 1 glutamine amidotransferase [Nitriliruptorales bacterium]